MKKDNILGKLAVFLLVSIIATGFVQAQSPPKLPHSFYGTAEVKGDPVPNRTTIVAKVDGEEKGSITTDNGSYGGPGGLDKKLRVQNVQEPNATIKFYINNIPANENATFKSGEISNLNLTWNIPGQIPGQPGRGFLCRQGTTITVEKDTITVNLTCSRAVNAIVNNVSQIGNQIIRNNPNPNGLQSASQPHEVKVRGPVTTTVTMSYDDSGINENTVSPFKFTEGSWNPLRGNPVVERDTQNNKVTFRIPRARTPYALFAEESTSDSETSPSTGGGGGGGGGAGGFYQPPQDESQTQDTGETEDTQTSSEESTETEETDSTGDTSDSKPTPTAETVEGEQDQGQQAGSEQSAEDQQAQQEEEQNSPRITGAVTGALGNIVSSTYFWIAIGLVVGLFALFLYYSQVRRKSR